MSRGLKLYFVLLLSVVLGWLWLRVSDIADFEKSTHWEALFGISALYLLSHIFRMLRLALLTLDERDKIFPLIAAHTLTAFPSSFLPFKIGEVLRLASFFRVFEEREKALAVWLAERFGDVVVLTTLIFGLSLFDISVPLAMRNMLVLFVLASMVGLVGLFAIAKVFVYLNRHLVLTSLSPRGLTLLRASHALRRLEGTIYKSVEGRLSGFLLLSVLIWATEILALSLSISQLTVTDQNFGELFVFGLLASLPSGGGNMATFGLYQSLTLAALTLVFLLAVWIAVRLRILRA